MSVPEDDGTAYPQISKRFTGTHGLSSNITSVLKCHVSSQSFAYAGYTNPLKPNEPYRGRTAPLTSKRCILYIYSINIGTEYFKHGIYSPFFSSSKYSLFHNSNVFSSCIIHILYTGCSKIKKIIQAPKGYHTSLWTSR